MNMKPQRLVFTAVVAAFGLLLVACQQPQGGGSLSVEHSGGITFLRSDGHSDAPDIYYQGTVTIGPGDCLYVEFPGEAQELVILDDDTEVTADGLITPEGFEVAYGEQVNVVRTNAGHYDMEIDGVEGCDDSGRSGIAFVGDPR